MQTTGSPFLRGQTVPESIHAKKDSMQKGMGSEHAPSLETGACMLDPTYKADTRMQCTSPKVTRSRDNHLTSQTSPQPMSVCSERTAMGANTVQAQWMKPATDT